MLMQVVLHSQIAEEEGLFNLGGCGGRHQPQNDLSPSSCVWQRPGGYAGESSAQLGRTEKERKGRSGSEEEIAAVPRCLPALIRTQKIQKKTGKILRSVSERRGQLPGGKGSPGRPGARERFCRSWKAGRQPPSSDLQSSAAERDQRRRSAGRCPGELVKNL